MKNLDFYIYISGEILKNKKKIKIVIHDFEGDWQILDSWKVKESNLKLISMQEAIELDNSISELLDMPKGIYAEKLEFNDPWEFYRAIE